MMLAQHPQIFHPLKAIFVHVPKTAGTSIEQRLRGPESKASGHSTALGYRRAFPREFASYFKFAVAREPVDRFLSAFYYLRQTPVHPALNNQAAHDCASPGEFAARLSAEPRLAARSVHLRPQWEFVCDHAGMVLVDEVYRFEALEAAWRDICECLGIPPGAPGLGKTNRSRRPAAALDATTDVLAFVRKAYARDYEIFNYGT